MWQVLNPVNLFFNICRARCESKTGASGAPTGKGFPKAKRLTWGKAGGRPVKFPSRSSMGGFILLSCNGEGNKKRSEILLPDRT